MSKRDVLSGLGLLVLTLSLAGLTGCACMGGGSKAIAAEPRDGPVVVDAAAMGQSPCMQTDLIGARGPDGPMGPAGEQGPIGLTGPAGTVLIGPRGAEGPAGPAGPIGATGAMGPAGAVLAGGAGVTGPAGLAGVQGAAGATGATGASAEGYAGPAGLAGPAGPRGETGETGAKGPTLVGPTGPAGRVGPAGVTGVTGDTGAVGATTPGIAGATGPIGAVGVTGAPGAAGATGVVGVVPCWVSYRGFWFEAGKSDIRASDATMAADIAAYMKQNPSLRVGLDGYMDSRDMGLSNNRVNAVRDALITAGVPADRIQAGEFGDPKNRQDRRVEVLIETTK